MKTIFLSVLETYILSWVLAMWPASLTHAADADILVADTDRPLPGWLSDARRELMVEKRYLNLPVKNGAPKRLLSFLVSGRTERQFEIELADAEPDWWAFMDMTPFKDKPALIQLDKLKEGSAGLISIEQGDQIKGAGNLYHEKLRPQFHFSSRRGWNNDPNGLVYYAGEYHLFYQHNPYGWNWGNMHWGHATSRDLMHWQELADALYPDELGTMFSGSAVVDWHNTAGFQQGQEKAIVCIYTAAGGSNPASRERRFSQCIAYSQDRGLTWHKYENNPVLSHIASDNRDPKVIWYAPEKKWVMALFLDRSEYTLFSSQDLKRWERLSNVRIPGTDECPEIFALPVDGDRNNTRWVFYGGNGRYIIGRFDGKTFTQESGPHALSFGNCFYASQTFSDIPPEDGRRIQIAWGTVALPGMPFNQMMDFPVELTLRSTEEGLRIFAYPLKEIESLHAQNHTIPAQPLRFAVNPLASVTGELFDIAAEVTLGGATEISFNLRGVPVVYDAQEQALSCQGKKAALKPVNGKIRLRCLVDRASIEIFANDGQVYMPIGVILNEDNRSLELFAKGGGAQLRSLSAATLKSTWSAK